jgi:pSer/pThr/pTyr-binding forkhead associated (FHA) protein
MTLINQEEKKSGEAVADVALEAKTVVLTRTKEKEIGPRLVCTTVSGENEIYPLNEPKLVIGRSIEANINLLDPLVSRKHCVIEKRDNGFVVRNVSTTNPLKLNDKAIVEKRLFSGDQLKIGSTTLTFISDRSEDVRKIDTKLISQNKRSGWALWLAAFLMFGIALYFAYFQAYTPLKVKWALKSASKQVKLGKYLSAQSTIKNLLDLNLPPEPAGHAMELLADTALAITEQKAQYEDLESAMEYLKKYLAEYGTGKEAEVLWDRLDYYRLTLAHRLESAQKFQPALRQYAAIKEDSIYFEDAHKAIRRIWLAHQQQSHRDQTLVQLLKDADKHFRAKRYLKPANQNAFVLYQAVLTLKPEHKLALSRINQMKTFYNENGEKYFANQQWAKALSYFERYYLIDTENETINRKLKICREKLKNNDGLSQNFNYAGNASQASTMENQSSGQNNMQAEKREQIKRLLEASGTESSWIMKYLFEDQKNENSSEKPW